MSDVKGESPILLAMDVDEPTGAPTINLPILQKEGAESAANVEMEEKKHTVFDSSFPVHLPPLDSLHFSRADFDDYTRKLVGQKKLAREDDEAAFAKPEAIDSAKEKREASISHPFMDALLKSENRAITTGQLAEENKTLTENRDVAYISTNLSLVDLFYELERKVTSSRLETLLEAAWKEDPLATLKIIFNSRSIHLGKGERDTCYRCFGWLAQRHPYTLLVNLKWLVLPVIPKKMPSNLNESGASKTTKDVATDDDPEFTIVDDDMDTETVRLDLDDEASHLVKYGVAHGYWKDLLNILALAANDELKFDGTPNRVLEAASFKGEAQQRKAHAGSPRGNGAKRQCTEPKKKRYWNPYGTREGRLAARKEHHEAVSKKLEVDPFYKALHATVARLFAAQLKADRSLLDSSDTKDRKLISLAGKWAPTFGNFHDKQTFVASSIAEILFPDAEVLVEGGGSDRELYLKHAREACRHKYISPLRKHIDIVERHVSDGTFADIKYERVPSLALRVHQKTFQTKDYAHFDQYLDKVAEGKSRISGAILLPGQLVERVQSRGYGHISHGTGYSVAIKAKQREMEDKMVDGQWKTMVQRIKDSGKLNSAIAVCDTSGSMGSPILHDGTTPLHNSLGLSLVIAEVTAPPFGGAFITFSDKPQVHKIDTTKPLSQKIAQLSHAHWDMNTDLEAVFVKLLLPLAREHNLAPGDMVKQVFVFSDMQFDEASRGGSRRWTSTYERIKEAYAAAGYEVPQLVFWDLAGGPRGCGGGAKSKPVMGEEAGTALVSGYSQAMMKMFLDNGQFDGEEEEEEEEEDGFVGVEKTEEKKVQKKKQKKKTVTPLSTVWKAISHKAYAMLKVVD